MSELADPFILETAAPGVVVRELLTEADDAAFQAAYDASRDDIARVDPYVLIRHLTPEATTGARRYARDHGRVFTGIWDEDTFVGSVDIRPQMDGSVEIGYWTDSRHTGNHYASLGATAVVSFLANVYQRVVTKVEPRNVPSIHVSENAGLQLTSLGSQRTKWLTFELLGARPCPFPSLEGAERIVRPGDYRVIDGTDRALWLAPGALDVVGGREKYYPQLLPGIHLRGTYSADGKELPIVSFLYNKLDESGKRERDQRVIIAEGVGYGVHPGHAGQPPTWYLVGPKVGVVDHVTGEIVSSVKYTAETPANNFSIACITNGPFGIPLLANPPSKE